MPATENSTGEEVYVGCDRDLSFGSVLRVPVCIYVYIYVCVCVKCTHTYRHAYSLYKCVYIYIYIYIYTHMNTCIPERIKVASDALEG